MRAAFGVALLAAAIVASTARAVPAACQSEAAFRQEATQLVYSASFLGTVSQARSLERAHLYDILHRQFVAAAASPPPTVAAACGGLLVDASQQAARTRAAIIRVNTLIAGFPAHAAASSARWRPVYLAAITGTSAAIRLGQELDVSASRVARLQADLVALRRLR